MKSESSHLKKICTNKNPTNMSIKMISKSKLELCNVLTGMSSLYSFRYVKLDEFFFLNPTSFVNKNCNLQITKILFNIRRILQDVSKFEILFFHDVICDNNSTFLSIKRSLAHLFKNTSKQMGDTIVLG